MKAGLDSGCAKVNECFDWAGREAPLFFYCADLPADRQE
jgi:hypothetical protein